MARKFSMPSTLLSTSRCYTFSAEQHHHTFVLSSVLVGSFAKAGSWEKAPTLDLELNNSMRIHQLVELASCGGRHPGTLNPKS